VGKLRILSRSGRTFADRREAGLALAAALEEYRGKNAVVLGIPRGGVVVAAELARALGAELDIVLARKLGTPGHSELAMGSVAEDGKVFLNDEIVRDMGISKEDIEREKVHQMSEINRRCELFRAARPQVDLTGRIAIVTDDGIATGATFQAALWAVREEHPQKLIAALPVGPEDNIARLAADVDEMLCLRSPLMFMAVGQFFRDFEPVEDEEVLKILEEEGARVRKKNAAGTGPGRKNNA
jgi:predicted phosphoribosyltransferase